MTSKLYGYAGKLLRADLTHERVTEEMLDEETARKYIGGTGIGAKYLYEETLPGTEWSDEGNRIIMASGPLGGTRVGGSGTFSVVTKGTLTNGATSSQANGLFGAYLRFSGYDGIILQGIARRWVYLYIHDGKAEFRDAGHLVGKDTWETTDIIKDELKRDERGMSVACIGPAGENLVKFACILVDKGHVVAHNGVGAVMGSKKLKAIAVARGKMPPALKHKEQLSTVAKQFHDNIMDNPITREDIYKWGTLNGVLRHITANDGILPVKNFTTTIYDIKPEQLEKWGGPYIRNNFKPKPNPCWACRMHHCHTITINEGTHKGYVAEEPEYEVFATFGPVIGVVDVTEAIVLGNQADRFGIDSNETGWALGLVIECYEKGILSKQGCDGLEMTWGNAEAASQMMRRIVTRQGLGNILAEGTMRAAQHIGGKAPSFAIHTMKGNTPRVHDHRSLWPMLFDTCLSQTSTDEGFNMANPADLGLSIHPSLSTNTSPDDTVLWNAQCKGAMHFQDSLGVCLFTTSTDLKLLAQAVSAATGWDFPASETIVVGKRIVNLLRAFNIRHGHTVEMDAPSPRYGSAPVDGPSKGISIMTHWPEMRNKYYELMGWDRTSGKPLPETLQSLGLDYVISDIW